MLAVCTDTGSLHRPEAGRSAARQSGRQDPVFDPYRCQGIPRAASLAMCAYHACAAAGVQ